MIKKYVIAMALVISLFFCNVAKADIDNQKAEEFVENVTREGLEEIVNSNISKVEKDKKFESLLQSSLDFKAIAKFVLGRYWRSATAEQREEFMHLYEKLNIETWSKRFDEFQGKDFVFHGTSPSQSKNQVFVNSSVEIAQGTPASVVWRVKETNGELKIVDIIIENISLAITSRNEYTAFIKNSPNGVEGLIENLEAKIKTN